MELVDKKKTPERLLYAGKWALVYNVTRMALDDLIDPKNPCVQYFSAPLGGVILFFESHARHQLVIAFATINISSPFVSFCILRLYMVVCAVIEPLVYLISIAQFKFQVCIQCALSILATLAIQTFACLACVFYFPLEHIFLFFVLSYLVVLSHSSILIFKNLIKHFHCLRKYLPRQPKK